MFRAGGTAEIFLGITPPCPVAIPRGPSARQTAESRLHASRVHRPRNEVTFCHRPEKAIQIVQQILPLHS